ncbi:hypothetical protein HQO38_16000 [Rhodococcus fascians]|jgi:hypothetical protein|uniref:Unannotated protein n=1 Tax=freshwater metagenome TaxID=449393 RepID=A0A6J7G3X0_9ZZZZ|nr:MULTISPECIES: membrane protein [Rhodococcus]MDP9635177.1 uncharacterized membrane protein YtjA (UPF0391 family) [Rhodococcus cercidiphylli]MSX06874.1 hypothetical protein [Actinomycetota bacterium]AMY51750.1 hypothetical protein A3L23_00389 [Rhodococcus fascians D188]MBJ7351945.1 hypothetical protein [Rhodococcus sp. (in: high G+C Gram-positive bacteria)]MBX5333601.1 hypothetical protein [Rhodococcus fascians]
MAQHDPAGSGAEANDDDRTMRGHAGEAIVDARNWPGYICIGLALVSLGLTLTAAGYGFEGWAWTGAVLAPVLLVAGTVLVLLERRRVKAQEGKSLTDPAGH